MWASRPVPPRWYETLAWRARRHQARRHLLQADLAVRRFASARNISLRNLAAEQARRLDYNPPRWKGPPR
jgi:hypothetical protein